MIVLCEIYICMCVSIHICYIYVCIYSVFPENKDIHQHVGTQPSLWTKSHFHTWLLKKNIALTMQTFVSKVMSLLFKTLSSFVIALLPRGKCLYFMDVVTICSDFGTQENKVCHCFHFSPIYLPWSDWDWMSGKPNVSSENC